MILPSALFLGVSFVIPAVDKVPSLNVEQVCQGIAQQGGVSFRGGKEKLPGQRTRDS
jgi:hypothetical protein